MAEHAKIHVIELSKWNKSRVENDLDIWAHFFKEGKTFSLDGLPEDMLTQEMEEAMAVLKQFSEKERDYDRYTLRVEYLRNQFSLLEDREAARTRLDKYKKDKLGRAEAKIEILEVKMEMLKTRLEQVEIELLEQKNLVLDKEFVLFDAQGQIESLKKQLGSSGSE